MPLYFPLTLFNEWLLGFRDNSLAFYVGSAMALLAIPVVYQLDVQVVKNQQSVMETARKIVSMIDVDAFLLVEIVVGMCWSWHRSFLSVYLDMELHASKTLLGKVKWFNTWFVLINLIHNNRSRSEHRRSWNYDYVLCGQNDYKSTRST